MPYPADASHYGPCSRKSDTEPHPKPLNQIPRAQVQWALLEYLRVSLLFSQAGRDVIASTLAHFQREEGLLSIYVWLPLLPGGTHAQDAEMKVASATLWRKPPKRVSYWCMTFQHNTSFCKKRKDSKTKLYWEKNMFLPSLSALLIRPQSRWQESSVFIE